MRNADVVRSVRRYLQEPAEGFYSDSFLKEFIIECQREMAQVVQPAFEIQRTFSSASGTAKYAIPTYVGTDTFGIFHSTYDTYDLSPITDELDINHDAISTQRPWSWYVQGDIFGLYGTPNDVKSVVVYTHRATPYYLFTVSHDGTNNANNATVRRSGFYLVCYYKNTTDSSTNSFGLTSGAYSGIAGLVSGINALGSGFVASIHNEILSTEPSVNVENFNATACLNSGIYIRPELECPAMFAGLIVEGVKFKALEEDGKEDLAEKHKGVWVVGLENMKRQYGRQKNGYGFRRGWTGGKVAGSPLGSSAAVIIS